MAERAKEQNYWPGFVDALSNVVLTLVFVLVVFVFALVITSSKVAQKASQFVEERRQEEQVERQKVSNVQGDLATDTMELGELETLKSQMQQKLVATKAEIQETKQQLERAEKSLGTLQQKVEDQDREITPSVITERMVVASEGTPEKAGEDEGQIGGSSAAIVITFPGNVFKMNDRSKGKLAEILTRYKDTIAGTKSVLTAYTGPESYSRAKLLAYYRVLDIRNILLERKVATGQTVTFSIKQGRENDDGRVEIRFVRH